MLKNDQDKLTFLLAVWFHDIIYDGTKADNED